MTLQKYIDNPPAGFEYAATIISKFQQALQIFSIADGYTIKLDWVCRDANDGSGLWLHGQSCFEDGKMDSKHLKIEKGEVFCHWNQLHFKRHMEISMQMNADFRKRLRAELGELPNARKVSVGCLRIKYTE